jgi:hypothetical protein
MANRPPSVGCRLRVGQPGRCLFPVLRCSSLGGVPQLNQISHYLCYRFCPPKKLHEPFGEARLMGSSVSSPDGSSVGATCRSRCTGSPLSVAGTTLSGASCRLLSFLASSVVVVPAGDRLRQTAPLCANSDHAQYRARCGIVRHRRCLQSPLAVLNAFGLFAAAGLRESKATHVPRVAAASIPTPFATSLQSDLSESR